MRWTRGDETMTSSCFSGFEQLQWLNDNDDEAAPFDLVE